MMSELKKCPFCGGENAAPDFDEKRASTLMETSTTYPKYYNGNFVECQDCLCGTGYFKTEQDAIDAWNRRADGWISVDERLPDTSRGTSPTVLITGNMEHTTLGFLWDNGNWQKEHEHHYIPDGYVTHWQALPEPPKESEGTDGA